MSLLTRRALLVGGVVTAGAAVGAAARAVGRTYGLIPPDANGLYGAGATMTYAAHRLFGRHALAREFPREMISEKPFANELAPFSEAFLRHQAAGFVDWRLEVQGLVDRPLSLSLPQLRAMEQRSQITEVMCEEGWSYIAEWSGTPLAAVLTAAGARPTARYVVYFSADPYWTDSIDIDEAKHPQTLLALGMNGGDLPVPFGGPLRLRVPRQRGYKSVKFINRIVVTDTLTGIGPDRWGYSWYAGA